MRCLSSITQWAESDNFMNLYIESLAGYVTREWDRALKAPDGPKEVRFIVQSLDPNSALELFQALEDHYLRWLQQLNITCHFRVATGLWNDWNATLGRLAEPRSAIAALDERSWIDKEDRLTWYRNRTVRDENVDALVVVLVGLNHATDQGGLVDSYRVDEARIWREMKGRFISWIERIDQRMGLSESQTQMEQFDIVLQKLFGLRPLRLGKLAEFLEPMIAAGGCDNLFEFSERFFRQLPFWDIPPAFANGLAAKLQGKKGAAVLKEADAFISHQRYKTDRGQKNDWEKIERALSAPEFEPPATLDKDSAYENVDAYRETLRAFIYEADAAARARLLRTDFTPLLAILHKKKPDKDDDDADDRSKTTIPAFTGMSFEVLLQGVWRALRDFTKARPGQPLMDRLAGVHVELVSFEHDLTADEEEGIGAKELARELLRGCLGGLETVFENIDCRLPVDEDQACLPRSQWERRLPITLDLKLDDPPLGTSRARPNVKFRVEIADADGELTKSVFKWVLSPIQPERVRFECAKEVRRRWAELPNPLRLLPAFRITSVRMTALYFAADEEEANRLVSQAMTDMDLVNLLKGMSPEQMEAGLWTETTALITAYWDWLNMAVTEGYYTARAERLPQLLNAFISLTEKALDPNLLGAAELLRRLYKAFLLVDERADANDPYLPAAVAWGLSPAVLELTQAQVAFLADGFPEAMGILAVGGDGEAAFKRLLDLAQIHRPLAALVVDSRHLSAVIKSFGLLHYFGSEPDAGKSLAVQTLLRDDESDDDEDVSDITHSCEEQGLVRRVLKDYQDLYPFAADGLRILAVNVKELPTILAGVNEFLEDYLKPAFPDWPPFHCTVMVYTTAASPLAMENRLTLWRDHVLERRREQGRSLVLSVGHRYAPKEQIKSLLEQEARLYDIAFLFHFLRGGMVGHADRTDPFKFHFQGRRGLQFPIVEYPRPIKAGDRYRRQSLLSNRRLRIQTRHGDMSARLCSSGDAGHDDVIYGEVNYKPWSEVVEALHQRAQWVACVDSFVDKGLLVLEDKPERRKIVGFTSGLGAYGELNLTVSTEQDTLNQLTGLVKDHLIRLLPFAQPAGFETMATRVVNEAEGVIGLASLRAVVGSDQRIRDVVSFAAVWRALASPPGQMSQLAPLDSLRHWLGDGEVSRRPDLLQLTLEARPDDIPLVHAVVIECKLAQRSPAHLAQAVEQVSDGLRCLTRLLAPERDDLRRLGFDRRYWWAQLHRAMSSRAMVNLPEQQWRALDQALESLAEGQFEIRWHGVIFTFWTNEPGPQPEIDRLALPAGVIEPPFETPPGFAIQHVSLGHQGLSALFAEAQPQPLLKISGPAIVLRPGSAPAAAETETKSQPPPVDESSGVIQPPPATPASTPPVPSGAPPVEPTPPLKPTDGATIVVDPFTIPEKILIGAKSNGESVYWHFGHSALENRHLLIFGTSGSGKTYGIQCLLAEMARQRLHSLIIDYTDGFVPQRAEPLFSKIAHPQNYYVKLDKIPLSPFRPQCQIIDPERDPVSEKPYDIADRIASIFTSVFPTIGDQQRSALVRAIEAGIESNPDFRLDHIVEQLRQEGPNGESLANKIEPLIKSKPFKESEESAWESLLAAPERWVQILQLTGMSSDTQKMVTEFVLWDLWNYALNTGSKNRPIPIVLDEIQTLDHSKGSPIDKMLREGRKFGLALMLATQTMSRFNKDERDRLFLAAHKLYFKPSDGETGEYAQLLYESTGEPKSDWVQRLNSLEKGQCWSVGPVLTSAGKLKRKAVLVHITSLEQRHFEG